MPTGVEVAGLVLAAFPLCIEFVKLYVAGAETIIGMRHHRSFLRDIHRQLNVEIMKFKNTLYDLFREEISHGESKQLFRDRRKAEKRLLERLRTPEIVDTFIQTVQALEVELNGLKQSLLALVLDDKSSGSEKLQKLQAECSDEQLVKRVTRNLKKRFIFAVLKKKDIEQRMQKLKNINEDIYRLAKSGGTKSAITGGLSHGASLSNASKADLNRVQNYYKRVQASAQSICNVLRRGIQVPHGCEDLEHNVSLCLELRDALQKKEPVGTHSALQFRIVFSVAEAKPKNGDCSSIPVHVPTTFSELEVEPIDRSEDEEDSEPDDMRRNDPPPKRLIPSYNASQPGSTAVPVPFAANDEQELTAADPVHVLPQLSRSTTPTPKKRVAFLEKASTKISNFIFPQTPSAPETIDLQHPIQCGVASLVQVTKAVISTMDQHSNEDTQVKQVIQDSEFCQKIRESTSMVTRRCLGFLEGDPDSAHRYHRLWSMPSGGCFDLAGRLHCSKAWFSNSISLRVLLEADSSSNRPSSFNRKFPMKARLSLGIKLASSVIQLHTTQWLNSAWSKHDIILLTDPEDSTRPLTEKPVILRNITGCSTSVRQQQQQVVAAHGNKILFSLGIVLWELWFGMHLEDLSFADEDIDFKSHSKDYVEWSETKLVGRAFRALQELEKNAPMKYGAAVRACLVDAIPTDTEGFTSTVWERVVRPLQENLNYDTHGIC